MKHRTVLFYLVALLGVLTVASLVMGMSAAGPVPQEAAVAVYQDTAAPTIEVGLTPPVVVVTGVVPVTGEPQQPVTNWFFLAILLVAGLAFLVAVAALLRRPNE